MKATTWYVFPWFQAVGQAVRPCRFSVALLLLGAFVMLVPDQTAEALSTVCQRNNPFAVAALIGAVVWWGHTSWYFARTMTRFVYPDYSALPSRARAFHRSLVVWIPRALGVLPICVVAVALFRCAGRTRAVLAPAAIVVGTAAVFASAVVLRRRVLRWVRARFAERVQDRPLVQSLWQEIEAFERPDKRQIKDLPYITRVCLGAHVAAFFILFALFTVRPVEVAQWLGAPTILVVAIGSWVAVGSAITYLSSWLRVPLMVLLVAEAIVVSPWTDDHLAKPRPPDDASLLLRPSVEDDFAQWRRDTNAEDGTPFLVVATEGGGIRAAYWTAALLTALQKRDRRFGSRVYAISSVSGGSLGAAIYEALLASDASGDLQPIAALDLQGAAARILSVDSLAPPLAKLLYPDLVQRFIPLAWGALDRGQALERSWTVALGKEVKTNLFERPFDRIWEGHSVLPRLFLNTTWVETGARAVLSYPKPSACQDTADAIELAIFTLAEAVHASARFPYISPAATMPGTSDRRWGHLVDGGYFENSGAATAQELLGAIGHRSDARVVVIRYDDGAGEPSAAWLATELTSPPFTMFNARDARGTLAVKALKGMGIPVVELSLRPASPALPLGWMLSAGARTEINRQVDEVMKGRDAENVISWLR